MPRPQTPPAGPPLTPQQTSAVVPFIDLLLNVSSLNGTTPLLAASTVNLTRLQIDAAGLLNLPNLNSVEVFCSDWQDETLSLQQETSTALATDTASSFFDLSIVSLAVGVDKCVYTAPLPPIASPLPGPPPLLPGTYLSDSGLPFEIPSPPSAPPPPSPPCASGTYSLPSALQCLPCPLGAWCAQGRLNLCPPSTYSDVEQASQSSDCKSCPDHATSPEGAPSIDACTCDAEGYYELPEMLPSGELCEVCPIGAECSSNRTDASLKHLVLKEGYWRWRRDLDAVLLCPDAGMPTTGCVGGARDYCKQDLTGPYCMLCVEALRETHYYETWSSTCEDCSSLSTPLIIYALLLPVIMLACMGCIYLLKSASPTSHLAICCHQVGWLRGARRAQHAHIHMCMCMSMCSCTPMSMSIPCPLPHVGAHTFATFSRFAFPPSRIPCPVTRGYVELPRRMPSSVSRRRCDNAYPSCRSSSKRTECSEVQCCAV